MTVHPPNVAALARIVELQQRDQQMIAYEIHDGLLQDVIAAKMLAEALLADIQPHQQGTAESVTQLLEVLDRAINEGRCLVRRLRPLGCDARGAVETIHRWTRELAARTGFHVQVDCPVADDQIPEPLAECVWRIVREAVTNAQRHSGTERAVVRLRLDLGRREMTVVIGDSGVGFDPHAIGHGHYGVESMRQRAALLDGELTIDSQPGQGTQVCLRLPMNCGAWREGN